jgi:5-methyltetrahydropteroyltriglutamate--homocysteine methyltransferase
VAISDALNEELHDLVDAGWSVIALEEPQIHLLAARGIVDEVINPQFMLEVFNNTVRGRRAKTEVWCHTCWGTRASTGCSPWCSRMSPRSRSSTRSMPT